MTCMINKWRAKIDWKGIYNVKDPPRMGIRKEVEKKKGEDDSNLHDLGNLCNLALKKEEEH